MRRAAGRREGWRGWTLLLLALGCAPAVRQSPPPAPASEDEAARHYKLFARTARGLPLESRASIIAELRRLPGFKERPAEEGDDERDAWHLDHDVPRRDGQTERYTLSVIQGVSGRYVLCLLSTPTNSLSEAVYALEEELGMDASRDEKSGAAVWQLPDRVIQAGPVADLICVLPSAASPRMSEGSGLEPRTPAARTRD